MTAVGLATLAICVFICAAAKSSKQDICVREKTRPGFISPKPEKPDKAETQKRFAGASPVPDGRYPYIVSLRELIGKDATSQDDFRYFCGATMIAPDWAITAASCVDANKNGVEDPGIFGGTIFRNGPFTELSFTSETFIHPGWVSKPQAEAGFDIALLKLPCRSNLPIIKLPPKDFKTQRADLRAMGWGRTGPSSSFVDIMNEVKLPFTRLRRCSTVLKRRLAKSLICAGKGVGDVCQGDTGGPLVAIGKSFQNDVLVGISPELLSNCDYIGKPIVFTSVAAVRDWIDKTIAENSEPDPVDEPVAEEEDLEMGEVFGSDIVKALQKGRTRQPKAAELVGVAVEQDRTFAVVGAVRISKKRGLAEEMATAIVEATDNGVDEKELTPALDLAFEALGD